ncbi:hypothetical protein [uncultured Roseobacter sp.]|uniref:hypothetical protein n=1 Tax=uncultured Roseobacter sp. TaxID=114847 RepID=UPI002618D573|nr:hypothetical protein [uncultured Roseobacter sp.]
MTTPILINRSSLRRTALLWAAVFPLITLVLALTGPVIGDWPLIARTFVLTLIVVPLLNFWIMPHLMARFGHWIEAG